MTLSSLLVFLGGVAAGAVLTISGLELLWRYQDRKQDLTDD